jgi:hypothetical protein
LLWVKLHFLIWHGVSSPSFDTLAQSGVIVSLHKAINHWRNLVWPRFEPWSPKWHTGAISTTPWAHALELQTYFYWEILMLFKHNFKHCIPMNIIKSSFVLETSMFLNNLMHSYIDYTYL